MNINLVIGHGEIGFDFETEEEREMFFNALSQRETFGFIPASATKKVGMKTLRLFPEKFDFNWSFRFSTRR